MATIFMVPGVTRFQMVFDAREKLSTQLPAIDYSEDAFFGTADIKIEELNFDQIFWLGDQI